MWNRPGVAKRLVGRLRDAAALAGDQGVGDGAGLARQRLDDAPADGLAHARDRRASTCSESGGSAELGLDLRRRGGVADGAQPLEPGGAREIVVAGQRRPRRRAQRGLEAHRHRRARGLRLRSSCARARDRASRMRLVLLQRRHADGEALALAGARLDQLDEAIDVDGTRSAAPARVRARLRCAACRQPIPAPPPTARPSQAQPIRAAARTRCTASAATAGSMAATVQRLGRQAGNRARCRRRTSPAATETSGPARLRGCVLEPQERQLPRHRTWRQPGDARGRGSTPPTCAIAPTLPRHPRRAGDAIQALDQHTERNGDKRRSHSPAVAEGQLCGLRRPSRPSSA